MTLDASDALTQLTIFGGVVLGSASWTIWQWQKAQNKFDQFDVSIVFDKRFLGTALGAVITAFVLVAGSFNTFLGTILEQNPNTYIVAFFSSFGLGFTFNAVGNQLVPSPANTKAEKVLDNRKFEDRAIKMGLMKPKEEETTTKKEDSDPPHLM